MLYWFPTFCAVQFSPIQLNWCNKCDLDEQGKLNLDTVQEKWIHRWSHFIPNHNGTLTPSPPLWRHILQNLTLFSPIFTNQSPHRYSWFGMRRKRDKVILAINYSILMLQMSAFPSWGIGLRLSEYDDYQLVVIHVTVMCRVLNFIRIRNWVGLVQGQAGGD